MLVRVGVCIGSESVCVCVCLCVCVCVCVVCVRWRGPHELCVVCVHQSIWCCRCTVSGCTGCREVSWSSELLLSFSALRNTSTPLLMRTTSSPLTHDQHSVLVDHAPSICSLYALCSVCVYVIFICVCVHVCFVWFPSFMKTSTGTKINTYITAMIM